MESKKWINLLILHQFRFCYLFHLWKVTISWASSFFSAHGRPIKNYFQYWAKVQWNIAAKNLPFKNFPIKVCNLLFSVAVIQNKNCTNIYFVKTILFPYLQTFLDQQENVTGTDVKKCTFLNLIQTFFPFAVRNK